MDQETNPLHHEIMERLSKLDVAMGVVSEKCDGINRRLDITNGRIAKVEGVAHTNEKDLILLQERGRSGNENDKRKQAWTDWAGKGAIGFALMCAGAITLNVLQRTGYINFSFVTVPEQQYESINSITEPYENR